MPPSPAARFRPSSPTIPAKTVRQNISLRRPGGFGDAGAKRLPEQGGEMSVETKNLGDEAGRAGSGSLVVAGVAALGIVYGDIGTSPLYAFKVAAETAGGGGPLGADPVPVLGILSLIVWSLLLVIAVKYVLLVMRADNHGEGGILALLALVRPWSAAGTVQRRWLIAIGIFGATLLYGDGVITPAISVLSAVEGLEVVGAGFTPWVKPITVTILIALFLVQCRGTAVIGRWFGPVMLVWFGVIAILGIGGILRAPQVLSALDPEWALALVGRDGWLAFLVFGAVFLALTGGEALYADMGHVGRRSIRLTWFLVVLPALLLNYAGQAAVMLAEPGAIGNPFFRLAPDALQLPMVVLATVATVIASQSLISGVFTLTRQAVAMGLWPRMKIVQTSAEGYGQIYLPVINYGLMVFALGVVLVFKSSDDMAAAYGIAVSGTMLITTLLLAVAMRQVWGWPRAAVLPLAIGFAAIDLGFFVSNLFKLPQGGWLPLAAGVVVFLLMRLWERGSCYLHDRVAAMTEPVAVFLEGLAAGGIIRTPGVGVFLTRTAADVPEVMQHHVKHNQVLDQHVIILTIAGHEIPRVPSRERYSAVALGDGLWRVTAHYGFMQTPNLPVVVRRCVAEVLKLDLDPDDVSYFVGHERVVASDDNPAFSGLSEWLFAFMAHNVADVSDYYRIPGHQVVEIGIRIDI